MYCDQGSWRYCWRNTGHKQHPWERGKKKTTNQEHEDSSYFCIRHLHDSQFFWENVDTSFHIYLKPNSALNNENIIQSSMVMVVWCFAALRPVTCQNLWNHELCPLLGNCERDCPVNRPWFESQMPLGYTLRESKRKILP